MKKVFILALSFLLVSCFSEPKKESDNNDSTYIIDTSSINVNSINKEQVRTKRFVFITITSEIPEIYNGETYKFSSKVEYTKEESIVYFCSLSFKDTLIVSEIIEIEDCDLEKQQNTLLKYKDKIKERLLENDKWLIGIKLKNCKNPEDSEKIKNSNPESKIVDTQIFVYDSYSEAIENKKNLYNGKK